MSAKNALPREIRKSLKNARARPRCPSPLAALPKSAAKAAPAAPLAPKKLGASEIPPQSGKIAVLPTNPRRAGSAPKTAPRPKSAKSGQNGPPAALLALANGSRSAAPIGKTLPSRLALAEADIVAKAEASLLRAAAKWASSPGDAKAMVFKGLDLLTPKPKALAAQALAFDAATDVLLASGALAAAHRWKRELT